jgi:DNA polymerase elongation subunit (family B)
MITQDVNKNNNIALRAIPFVISVAFFWSDSEELYRGYTISMYDHVAPQQAGVDAIIVGSEIEVLERFIQVLSQNKPDIISGFNDNSFDWMVILNRCEVYAGMNLLTKLYHALSLDACVGLGMRKVQRQQLLREQKIKIKGDEHITCNRLLFKGCITVDTMCLFRKMYPNDDRYSLNHFLTKLGLQQKDDVSYVELERYRRACVEAPSDLENLRNMGKVV